ncbi:MAG: AmmeMemoRadiSam system protein A [Pontibacterium sp.]
MPFTKQYTNAQQQLMLKLVRAAIARKLEMHYPCPVTAHEDWLQAPAATFVTLTIRGALRGCIGMLEPCRSLQDDLTHNAISAAFYDPRFPPLSCDEFDQLQVHISLLMPSIPLQVTDETDLLMKLHPGIDGLVLEDDTHRATFLPQVWHQLPEPEQFLGHLKQKAGLPVDYWSPDLRFFVYQVVDVKDQAL